MRQEEGGLENRLQAKGGSTAATLLCNCWQAIRLWHRCRRDIAILQAADDHMLKDLGIGRSEIESVVRQGRDPSQARKRKNS